MDHCNCFPSLKKAVRGKLCINFTICSTVLLCIWSRRKHKGQQNVFNEHYIFYFASYIFLQLILYSNILCIHIQRKWIGHITRVCRFPIQLMSMHAPIHSSFLSTRILSHFNYFLAWRNIHVFVVFGFIHVYNKDFEFSSLQFLSWLSLSLFALLSKSSPFWQAWQHLLANKPWICCALPFLFFVSLPKKRKYINILGDQLWFRLVKPTTCFVSPCFVVWV